MEKRRYYPPMKPKEACDVFLIFVDEGIECNKKRLKKYSDLGLETAVIEARSELRAYESCKKALINYLNGASYPK